MGKANTQNLCHNVLGGLPNLTELPGSQSKEIIGFIAFEI